MDAFFASVEQRDNPQLKGKPLAVGGSRERGVVAAASYEARKYGVKSAMASVTAAKLCPELIFVKPNFEKYKEASQKIKSIFQRYTDIIEPLSLDEAFLDVTINHQGIETATEIATRIRNEIKEELNLTASAGISYNKFLAKMASDINKPNGQFVIPPSQAKSFLHQLEVRKYFGIGKVTAEKMKRMGILYGSDLEKASESFLYQHFGKAGKHYFKLVRGIDNRPVNPSRIRKSIGAETTFEKDLNEIQPIKEKLNKVIERVFTRLEKAQKQPRTITLKLKFADFSQITRSKTLDTPFNSQKEIQKLSSKLLQDITEIENGCRLIGISLSNFIETKQDPPGEQLTLKL